jgi:hypothetical protein
MDAAGNLGARHARSACVDFEISGRLPTQAVQRLRDGDCSETLTDARRSRKNQARRQRFLRDRPRKQRHDATMADDVSKRHDCGFEPDRITLPAVVLLRWPAVAVGLRAFVALPDSEDS